MSIIRERVVQNLADEHSYQTFTLGDTSTPEAHEMAYALVPLVLYEDLCAKLQRAEDKLQQFESGESNGDVFHFGKAEVDFGIKVLKHVLGKGI